MALAASDCADLRAVAVRDNDFVSFLNQVYNGLGRGFYRYNLFVKVVAQRVAAKC
jgi:outer membrane phospholipase A